MLLISYEGAQESVCVGYLAQGKVAYRIYIDESGTHEGSDWLLIGMLFVPQHAELHKALCAAKESEGVFQYTAQAERPLPRASLR